MASGNYWDDSANKGSFNGETFYDKNKWLQASGYQKQGGGGDIRPYTGSYSAPGGYEDIVARQIALQQKANEPIISQLESEKEPLKQRYSQLIDQIKGNQKVAEDRQTLTTNNELGRRGISSQDGVGQQEMTNNLNPITQQYTNMIQDTGYNSEKALRDVASQIAQLKSGAISQGTNTGMALYQEDQNRLLQQQAIERQAEQQRQAQAAADRQYSTIDLPQSQAAIQNIMSTINNRGSNTSGGDAESNALAKIFGMDTVWNNGAPMSVYKKKPLSSYEQ